MYTEALAALLLMAVTYSCKMFLVLAPVPETSKLSLEKLL